jgi:predicted transcriptional regulator
MATDLQRPDLYVLARMLERLASAPEGEGPTSLQLACGINYTQLERYLAFMIDRGLVASPATPDGDRTVRITDRGHRALEFLTRAIRDLLQEEFDPRRAGRS